MKGRGPRKTLHNFGVERGITVQLLTQFRGGDARAPPPY